jgi:predicted DsbA family dithiol-disulfide isomerase
MPKEGQEIIEHITEKYGNPSDHQQLLAVVKSVDLDTEIAKKILTSNKYEQNIRQV